MSLLAPITLDRDAEVPLGTQLTWVLRARITGGELPGGERLPGARELAAHVGVNVNTVRSVFARLEEEGLLAVVHGRGTFVADRAAQRDDAAQFAAVVKSEAHRRGLDPRAVAAALYMERPGDAAQTDRGARPGGGAGEDGAASIDDPRARRELREQIARLERRLAKLPALAPDGDAAAAPPPLPSEAGRLLTSIELAQQRDRLAEQLADAVERLVDAAAEAEAEARAPERERASAKPARDRGTVTSGARLRWVPGG